MKENQTCILRFIIGNDEYAFKIDEVREVVRMVVLKEIPRLPEYVKGVFNLRGQIIMVIDLRERFGIKDYKNTQNTRIIITKFETKEIGFIVDAINKIEDISDTSITHSSDYPVKIDENFIHGIIKFNEQIIPILNVQGILNQKEKYMLEDVNEDN